MNFLPMLTLMYISNVLSEYPPVYLLRSNYVPETIPNLDGTYCKTEHVISPGTPIYRHASKDFRLEKMKIPVTDSFKMGMVI